MRHPHRASRSGENLPRVVTRTRAIRARKVGAWDGMYITARISARCGTSWAAALISTASMRSILTCWPMPPAGTGYSPDWPLSGRGVRPPRWSWRDITRSRQRLFSEGKTDRLAARFALGHIPSAGGARSTGATIQAGLPTPAPLWHLVFHDIMFHSSWEHATYNDGCRNGRRQSGSRPAATCSTAICLRYFPSDAYTVLPAADSRYYSIRPDSSSVQRALELAAGRQNTTAKSACCK